MGVGKEFLVPHHSFVYDSYRGAESFLGVRCPLTVWESSLRRNAGQIAYQDQDFIATWLGHLMFYHFPPWVFMALYSAFGLLVLSLFYIVPIRRK
ncbi:MAG: DUF2784 domain-containing protein [Alphaproteobacteria bacterium]